MRAPSRARREELLDAPALPVDELSTSLDHVAAVDRWLGGERAVRRHLAPLVTGREEGRLLDVGTGNGTVLRRLVAWARRVGGPGWRGVGVELHPDVVRAAVRRGGHPGIGLVRGDARRLPFRTGSFDAVVATLTLHHFPEGPATEVLAEMARVSRGLVIVSDLERSWPHYLGARLLAATWWRRDRFTRHDGPLSVLRSFTPPELRKLARGAELRRVVVRRHFPFRLVLEGRSTAGSVP